MSRPLIDGLKQYINEKNVRLHMPGHKGRDMEELLKLIPEIDLTEVPGVDNLHNPQSIIKEAEQNAATVFGAKKTFFSVNGTTSGIYASILSQTAEGDKVIVQRDCHKSVYQALVFGKLNPEYIYPVYDADNNILLGLDLSDIEDKINNDKDITAVIVTYPSYYGVCSDLEEIASIVHSHGKILIVDEAHGSHLSFHKSLPSSALELGADIVIQSTHKTLPAFTQSSMVHVGTDRVDIEKLKTQMSIFQTTSPSYMLMASLDFATDFAERLGEERLDGILNKISEITDSLNKLENVKIYNSDAMTYKSQEFDPTKFLFRINGITGKRLEAILRSDYNIQLEMSDYYYGLALITMSDRLEDLERLKQAVEDIASSNKYINGYPESIKDIRIINPKIIIPIYNAFYSDKISIQLSKAEGEVSGEFIIPYPPGVPILAPGEMVTKEIIEYINNIKKEHIDILSTDGQMETIKVIKQNN